MTATLKQMEDIALETKPDMDAVRHRMAHFWAGDVDKRPPVIAQCTKPGHTPVHPGHQHYYRAIHRQWPKTLDLIDQWLENTDFLGECVPCYDPDLGPDQYAAFFNQGAELICVEGSENTSWVEPVIDDLEQALPLRIEPDNAWWQHLLAHCRVLAEHGRGRCLVGMCDLHSNADTLLALCNTEQFCMDFLDIPEIMHQAMNQVRATYPFVYNGIYEVGGMSRATGSVGWIPLWCEGRYATIQCDYICMVSPDTAREFIIPALAEEAAFLDHCAYHLDGPGALPHLDDILSIPDIDVIQWVSGSGQPHMCEWLDLFRKVRAAGKSLILYPYSLDKLKELHRELGPRRIAYQLNGFERHEIEEALVWLAKNT